MRKSPRSTKVPQMYAAYELGPVPTLAPPPGGSAAKSSAKASPSPAAVLPKRRATPTRAAAKAARGARPTRSQAPVAKGTAKAKAKAKAKPRGKTRAKGTAQAAPRATGKRRRGSSGGDSAFADLVSLANQSEAKSSHPGVQLLPEALGPGNRRVLLSPTKGSPVKRQRTSFTPYGSPVLVRNTAPEIEGDIQITPVVELPQRLIPTQHRKPRSILILAHQGHCHGSVKAMRWARAEWHCSRTDELFFKHNEFLECLAAIDCKDPAPRPRREWTVLRRKLGVPRRMSASFFAGEREKLENLRKNVVRYHLGLLQEPALNGLFPVLLTPTTRVLVVVDQEIRQGIVVQSMADRYEVRLDPKPGSDVLQWVPERNVMEADDLPGVTMGSDLASPVASAAHAAVEPSPEKDPLETLALAAVVSPKHNGDVRSLVTVMDLLKRKEHLLYSLHAMNEQAESFLRAGDEYSPQFKQDYARLVISLEETSEELKPVLLQLRSSQHTYSAQRAKG